MPAFHDPSAPRHDLQVVREHVVFPRHLVRMNEPADGPGTVQQGARLARWPHPSGRTRPLASTARPRFFRHDLASFDPLDAHRQHASMWNAGLDRVDGRITRGSVAQEQTGWQIGGEPSRDKPGRWTGDVRWSLCFFDRRARRLGSEIDLGDALARLQLAVTSQPPEAAFVKQQFVIQIARGVHLHRLGFRGTELGGKPPRFELALGIGLSSETANRPEMIDLKPRFFRAQHDLHHPGRAHQRRQANGRSPSSRDDHRSGPLDLLEAGQGRCALENRGVRGEA
jgi:hypothetical protein